MAQVVNRIFSALLVLVFVATPVRASVDDALSYALEAAQPYVKQGFTVREDYWGGDMPVGQPKAITRTLST